MPKDLVKAVRSCDDLFIRTDHQIDVHEGLELAIEGTRMGLQSAPITLVQEDLGAPITGALATAELQDEVNREGRDAALLAPDLRMPSGFHQNSPALG
jgi:hypothetical protein